MLDNYHPQLLMNMSNGGGTMYICMLNADGGIHRYYKTGSKCILFYKCFNYIKNIQPLNIR